MAQFCILLNTIFRIHKPRPDPKEDWWVYPLDGELKVTKGNEENEVSPKLTSVNTTLFNKNDEHLRDVNKDELEAVRKMEESCVVIVSNLAETVTTDDLETLFRYHGDVICCNIHYNGSGQVVLNNEDNARRAVEEFEGQRLDDKELHCELAVSSKRYGRIN
jgi:RNA recognition motif-containing protein